MTLHAATFVGLFLVRLASGTSAAASLIPASSSYFALEPINLSLQITNQGRERIYVELDYPLFQYFGDYGIQLTVAGDAKFNLQRPRALERTSIVFSFISLNPGESRTITVFFQRYMGDLPPGTHHVLYSVRIPYWSWPDRRPQGVVVGDGAFDVTVLYGGEPELAQALNELAKSPFGEEAMCITSSPLAIPYVLKIGVYSPEQILPCLAKFRGEPSVAAAVLHEVRSGRVSSVVSALEVLGGWRQTLSVAEFDRLMQSSQFAVRSAALQYAAAIRERSYLDVVRKHARDDPDPGISEHAQHVQNLLEARK